MDLKFSHYRAQKFLEVVNGLIDSILLFQIALNGISFCALLIMYSLSIYKNKKQKICKYVNERANHK